MAVVYNALHRNIPCHPVYTSLRFQMEEKINKAIENGDKNEETRLKGFYSDMRPSYYLLETPVNIAGDYRFCFYNRQYGFAKLDMLVTDKTVSFEEYMRDLGYKTTILQTKESWVEFKLSFMQTDKVLSLVKLNFLPDQPLTFISKKDKVDHDLNMMIYLWGFEKCTLRYDNTGVPIENWAFGEVYCKAINIPGDKRIRLYTTHGMDKFINNTIEANVNWEYKANPINAFEMPSYTEGYEITSGFTLSVQGSVITDKTKIRVINTVNNASLPFTMDYSGLIKFVHTPAKPPLVNSSVTPYSTAPYKIEYVSGEVTTQVGVNLLVDYVLDNNRITFISTAGAKNGSKVDIRISLKDSYYPTDGININAGVSFVLNGKTTGVSCAIVNGVLTAQVPFTAGMQFIEGYIKMSSLNGVRCIRVPKITVSGIN